jgi:diadenosine tetraphosphatase ApaH/serine/threonine PP2A family protein phosphatase
MKYGILGDIHANLSALNAVLECFEDHGVDHVISVGDVVGYGAAPSECIARVREVGATVVKGNHDAACVDEIDIAYFNRYARDAVHWTKTVLSTEECEWLSSLPMVAHLEHCSVAHGTLHRPELFDYIQSTTDADPSLDAMHLPVCFVGHTHVPVSLLRLKGETDRTAYTFDRTIDLAESERALINVGSVGQPRDENPAAAYALFDSKENTIQILRAKYDIDLESARIRDAGLPPMLADRLYLGV